MKRLEFGILAVALAIVLGCGEMPPEPASATSAASPPPTPAPPGDGSGGNGNHVASTDAAAASAPAAGASEAPAEAMPAEDGAAPAAAPGSTDEVAQVGVGAKGQNYGGPGLVTTPIEAYFRAEERIAFEVQIPKAMQLYKAEHNDKGPKTQEEYMNIIIKENGVQLPELPEGEEYFYDPATEQLMVRHPKK
jgi:hypothetical protein